MALLAIIHTKISHTSGQGKRKEVIYGLMKTYVVIS